MELLVASDETPTMPWFLLGLQLEALKPRQEQQGPPAKVQQGPPVAPAWVPSVAAALRCLCLCRIQRPHRPEHLQRNHVAGCMQEWSKEAGKVVRASMPAAVARRVRACTWSMQLSTHAAQTDAASSVAPGATTASAAASTHAERVPCRRSRAAAECLSSFPGKGGRDAAPSAPMAASRLFRSSSNPLYLTLVEVRLRVR